MLRRDPPDILLGTDHPVIRSLLTNRIPITKSVPTTDPVPTQVRATTRAQNQAQAKGIVDDKAADVSDTKLPSTVVPTVSSHSDHTPPTVSVADSSSTSPILVHETGKVKDYLSGKRETRRR